VRLVVQRVSRASVRVAGETIAEIGPGLLVLAGVGLGERGAGVEWLARKLVHLRIFEDIEGKMNLSLEDVDGQVLVVPQFTLLGDITRGRRPSWAKAAPPEEAQVLVEALAAALERLGASVRRGAFRAHMEIELVNDGPVTLVLETPR
jgi:D-tyrosyl-tRNA(Tyr) deacylase